MIDYDDPSSNFIRCQLYWDGTLAVVHKPSNGANWLAKAVTNAADSGLTQMNLPQRRVAF